MVIDERDRDEKVQSDVNREAAKYHHYHQIKFINKYTLQVEKC